MYYEGECAVPDCGRPARDYHGDGQEIICYEHYLYDRAVLRRSQTIQQVRACCERSVAKGTLHTEIAYDHREKRYRLVATNGVELGRYRQRRQAEEAQLALEAPQALELARRAAERYPVLAGRALRAAQLVAADKVHLDTTCHQVASQNGAGEYQVEQTNSTWQCTCPDWQGSFTDEFSGAPVAVAGQGPMCKHILAVLMAIKLGQGDKGTRGQLETKGQGDQETRSRRSHLLVSPSPCLPVSEGLPLSPSPCLSWWDHQQALARFQEYARRVQEEGADPRLLLVLGQML